MAPPARPLAIVGLFISLTAVFAAPEWRHVASDHFEVYSAGDPANLPETVRRFERVYEVLAARFTVPPAGSARSRVVIFENDRALAPYRPRPDSRAFWFDTPNGDFMGLPPITSDTWPDAVHEITHLVVGRTGASYPVWLNEGLALYYSTLAFDGNRVRFGAPPADMVKTLTTAGFAIPLEQLFVPGRELGPEIDPRRAVIWYAESWALSHLLFQGDAYRDKSKAFLSEIAGGATTADALQKVFGKTVDALLGDVKRHLARLRLPSSVEPAPAKAPDAGLSVAMADAVAIDQTLAEMIGWQHDAARVTQGRAALNALSARAPASLALLEARGLLSFHKGHCGEARDDLRRAVEMNSQKAAVLRAYAQLMSAEPEHQRSLFARAAALDPVRPRPSIVVLPCAG